VHTTDNYSYYTISNKMQELKMKLSWSVKRAAIALLVLALFVPSVAAQGFEYDDIGITIKMDPAQVAPGGEGKFTVTLNAPFGFSVTDIESVFGIIPMNEIEGVTFASLIKPAPDKVDAVGGHFVGMTEFTLPFSVAQEAATGEFDLTIGFRLQACDEETMMCFSPVSEEDIQRTVKLIISDSGALAPEAGTEAASTAAPVAKDGGDSLEEQLQDALAGGNLWIAFAIAFVAGIITSLTPCVYPMIPITISYISGKSGGKKKNGFFISLVLVLGIAITYSILGVVAGATGGTFGAYLSHPVVQGFILVILTAMGLSMLGVWEMALPSGLTNKASVQKQGYLGALGFGLTLGIVAAPCVGPILVAMLLFIAQTQNLLLGFLLMFTYAIGMGILFIIVGTFSNAVLPKSGEWMNWLKKVFAFVFFIMGVYFAQSLINMAHPDATSFVIGALLVLWGGTIGAFFKLEKTATGWEVIGKSVGIILVVVGLIMFAGPFLKGYLPAGGGVAGEAVGHASPPWIRSLPEGISQQESSGKPMLVDVGAEEWCIACRELDEITFADATVIKELERFVVVKLDESDADYPEIKNHFEAKGYPIAGMPSLFFHNSDGEIVEVVNQFIPPETMLEKLKAVK
jgi:thiol:disulfide interchange protein DsbD